MARSISLVSKYTKAFDEYSRIFGIIPPPPLHLSVSLISQEFYFTQDGGTKEIREFSLTFDEGSFCFDITTVLPDNKESCPLLIILGNKPKRDELISVYEKHGGAIYHIDLSRLFNTIKVYKSKLYLLSSKSRRKHLAPSVVGIYAFIILRTLEYANSLGYINADDITVSAKGLYAFSALGVHLVTDGRVKFDNSEIFANILEEDIEDERLYCPDFLRCDDKSERIKKLFDAIDEI